MIIGLAGLSRSGKDTVAAHLRRYHGFVSFAFADPIKEMLAIIGMDARNEVTREYTDARFRVSARVAAQTLGTEWGREQIAPDIWITVLKERIKGYAHGRIVVTDVRFENEANWVRSVGELWHIVRPGGNETASHASEAGVRREPEDFVLMNDSTTDALFDKVNARMLSGG